MRKGYKVNVSLNKKILTKKKRKGNETKKTDENFSKGIDILKEHKTKLKKSRQKRIRENVK